MGGPPRDWCSVEECNRDVHALGLCEPHYRRHRKHGSVLAHLPVLAGARTGYLVQPLLCTCDDPVLDAIGEHVGPSGCHRKPAAAMRNGQDGDSG